MSDNGEQDGSGEREDSNRMRNSRRCLSLVAEFKRAFVEITTWTSTSALYSGDSPLYPHLTHPRHPSYTPNAFHYASCGATGTSIEPERRLTTNPAGSPFLFPLLHPLS